MNDQSKLNPAVTHFIENMWILCDAEGRVYCGFKGAGPEDGPDWQDRCVVWFRCRGAAERFYDDKTRHSNNLVVLVPRRMGSQWRKVLQVALNNGAKWIVGVGYQKGQAIRSTYLSTKDLLEGKFPRELIAQTAGEEDEKYLAMRRIESTVWSSCGDVLIQASLVPRLAKNYGLGEDVVATKLMVLAKGHVERLREAGET